MWKRIFLEKKSSSGIHISISSFFHSFRWSHLTGDVEMEGMRRRWEEVYCKWDILKIHLISSLYFSFFSSILFLLLMMIMSCIWFWIHDSDENDSVAPKTFQDSVWENQEGDVDMHTCESWWLHHLNCDHDVPSRWGEGISRHDDQRNHHHHLDDVYGDHCWRKWIWEYFWYSVSVSCLKKVLLYHLFDFAYDLKQWAEGVKREWEKRRRRIRRRMMILMSSEKQEKEEKYAWCMNSEEERGWEILNE